MPAQDPTKPLAAGTSLSPASDADLVGKWALCDMGYGRVSRVDEASETATVELPFGVCHVPVSSLQLKLAVTVQTFYKKEDSSVPKKVMVEIDLNQPTSAIFQHLASIYNVEPHEMILVNGQRHLRLPEPLNDNKSKDKGKSNSNSNSPNKVKARKKEKQAQGESWASEPSKDKEKEKEPQPDDQKQEPLTYPPLPPFDLCPPHASPHHRLLLIVDERALFRYQFVNDTNGIFYHLGTEGDTRPFSNPVRTGKVQIKLSTSGGNDTSCVCDRQPDSGQAAENSYGAESNPWIQITFNQHLVQPTYYVICQRGDHLLRNWQLEGCPDAMGSSWTVLDTRTNDPTIVPSPSGPRASCPGAFPVRMVQNSRQFYRSLRIRLTGPSHKGSCDFDITMLEFYGYLESLNKD